MWELPFLMCDIYISLDVICSTASILNLVAISFDRCVPFDGHGSVAKMQVRVAITLFPNLC